MTMDQKSYDLIDIQSVLDHSEKLFLQEMFNDPEDAFVKVHEVFSRIDADKVKHLEELVNEIEVNLRKHSESEVRENLISRGLTHQGLIQALIKFAQKSLQMFYDAENLRTIPLDDFVSMIDNVFEIIFVQRQALSLTEKDQAPQIQIDQERKNLRIIRTLLRYFYEQHKTLGHLRVFMLQSLSFDESRTNAFCDLILKHKNGLDSYFILSQLSAIMKHLNGDFDEE